MILKKNVALKISTESSTCFVSDCVLQVDVAPGYQAHIEHNVENVDACSDACEQYANCEFFTYIIENKYCSLRWDWPGAPHPSNYTPKLVSGYKSCNKLVELPASKL